MKEEKRKFKVFIYEQPYDYIVEAINKVEAHEIAENRHNGGCSEDIYKIEVMTLERAEKLGY